MTCGFGCSVFAIHSVIASRFGNLSLPPSIKQKFRAGKTCPKAPLPCSFLKNALEGSLMKVSIIYGYFDVRLACSFMDVPSKTKAEAKKGLKDHSLKQAKFKFDALGQKWKLRFSKYHKQPESVVLREMPTRWGSCTPKNKIILNPELIKAPTGCIEYVIVHELCHLVHRNHTNRFMELQNKEFPGWAKWKEKLEKVLA